MQAAALPFSSFITQPSFRSQLCLTEHFRTLHSLGFFNLSRFLAHDLVFNAVLSDFLDHLVSVL